jgi:hypothetical protein
VSIESSLWHKTVLIGEADSLRALTWISALMMRAQCSADSCETCKASAPDAKFRGQAIERKLAFLDCFYPVLAGTEPRVPSASSRRDP